MCTVIPLFSACSSPNAANIELRKQNQDLRGEIDSLKRQHEADQATIRGLQQDAATAPVENLFTVHGLSFGRLTGGADLDTNKPGDEGVKIYVTPTDAAGDDIKAAGSFVVEAFDLKRENDQRIGRWEFPLADAAKNWYGQALLNTYVLTCPWQTAPQHDDLTLKVAFTDGLTGRVFAAQKQVKVKLRR